MATVTFILGLCGSGKSWLADHLPGRKFDEGFLWNRDGEHQALIDTLQSGEDCVVVEIAYCQKHERQRIEAFVRARVPDVSIRWLCIENDLAKANKNCRERVGHSGDPEQLVLINAALSAAYTYPSEAEILPMWTGRP